MSLEVLAGQCHLVHGVEHSHVEGSLVGTMVTSNYEDGQKESSGGKVNATSTTSGHSSQVGIKKDSF